jgi:hypothetical protein
MIRARLVSPEAAEAEALLRGVWLSTEWVRQPALIEMDCANIIRALHAQTEDRVEGAGVQK